MATLKIKNLKKGFEGLSIIKGIDLEVLDKDPRGAASQHCCG
jgi:multiple sugar transport system ATP-binding protein